MQCNGAGAYTAAEDGEGVRKMTRIFTRERAA